MEISNDNADSITFELLLELIVLMLIFFKLAPYNNEERYTANHAYNPS